MSDRRLFGTDGIRGVAGAFPLDPATVTKVGWAIATALPAAGRPAHVLIGRDTRESGPAIENALAEGLHAGGAEVISGGVLTTPAVSFLASEPDFDAGIVISASHNPFSDNGIKVFGADGFKLSPEAESEVEALVTSAGDTSYMGSGGATRAREHMWIDDDPVLHQRYLRHLLSSLPAHFRLDGRRVVLDCANGSASAIGPEIFRLLGAEVTTLACSPDGRNINHNCGALHPDVLAAEVRARDASLGFAYDGDADRCILVDETGTVRDGDDVLAVAAAWWRELLKGGAVVTTVMANLGLELHLGALGLEMVRTPVGDKYVVDEMRRRGAILGGEQSGHIVFLDRSATGDGVLTSLMVARMVAESGRKLSELASCWTRLPQVLRNVEVARRVALETVPAIHDQMRRVESALAGRGRLLVRYSGTEPLLRIMLEGDDAREIDTFAADLANTVKESLG